MSIEKTLDFFKVAKPNPDAKDFFLQTAYNFEEWSEVVEAVGGKDEELYEELIAAKNGLIESVSGANQPEIESAITKVDRKLLADGISDAIVTLVGMSYMLGMDIQGALNEVADSNLSKYVYVGDRELTPPELAELAKDCNDIESQGRYVGVHWKRIENYVVFFDGSGKILKSPRNYFEPQLDKFLGVNNGN